jgi:urease accessory protein
MLQADLLVVNKIDLAVHVGADLERMRSDVAVARPDRDSVFTNLRSDFGAQEVYAHLVRGVLFDRVQAP